MDPTDEQMGYDGLHLCKRLHGKWMGKNFWRLEIQQGGHKVRKLRIFLSRNVALVPVRRRFYAGFLSITVLRCIREQVSGKRGDTLSRNGFDRFCNQSRFNGKHSIQRNVLRTNLSPNNLNGIFPGTQVFTNLHFWENFALVRMPQCLWGICYSLTLSPGGLSQKGGSKQLLVF